MEGLELRAARRKEVDRPGALTQTGHSGGLVAQSLRELQPTQGTGSQSRLRTRTPHAKPTHLSTPTSAGRGAPRPPRTVCCIRICIERESFLPLGPSYGLNLRGRTHCAGWEKVGDAPQLRYATAQTAGAARIARACCT